MPVMQFSALVVLLLLTCSVSLVFGHKRARKGIHAPFGESADSSSDTSTSSTSDSDSRESSIASAVEAALRAAAAKKFTPKVKKIPFSKFRLRLNTTNEGKACFNWKCSEISSCNAAGRNGFYPTNQTLALENAVVTITAAVNGSTTDKTFRAKFNGAGVADSLDDAVDFKVTFDGCQSFTVETVTGLKGVNITSLTVSTQERNGANAGHAYFEPIGDDGDFSKKEAFLGLNSETNATQKATRGESRFACDVTFDTVKASGYSSFVITPENQDWIVANTTGNLTASFKIHETFLLRPDANSLPGNREQIKAIGIDNLPCATRNRIVYDQTLMVTLRKVQRSKAADILDHPLIYDGLKASTAGSAANYDQFILQLQNAAGRTQIRLRDIALDQGAFSDLSHDTKFTSCFRVWPDPDFQINAFVGMRNGGGQVVRATLDNTALPSLVVPNGVVGGVTQYRVKTDAEIFPNNVPSFTTAEVAFGDLRLADLGKVNPPPRPYEYLRSDVTVKLEACPVFSYFQ